MRWGVGACRRLLAWTIAVGIAVALAPAAAVAATITPDTTADDFGTDPAHCSLREAVEAAQTDGDFGGCSVADENADTIVLTSGSTYSLTIAGGNENGNATGDLDVLATPANDETLTIQSSVPGSRATVDANGATTGDRALDLAPDGSLFTKVLSTVNLTDLNITDGVDSASDLGGAGIIVRQAGGNVNISDSRIFGNTASGLGGGIHWDANGTGVIADSTIDQNSGGAGGGIAQEGGSALTVRGSTLSQNTATSAISIGGGGIDVRSGGVNTIENSTISNNSSAGSGGGISNDDSPISLRNVTLAGNGAANSSGGGGFVVRGVGTVTARNSLIADNTDSSGTNAPDCSTASGGFVSEGYNLVESTAGCTFTANNDVTGVDPSLGALSDNGGPTQTRALLPSSGALDAGNPATPDGSGTSCLASDQRGMARGGAAGRCDIGAYEKQPAGTFTVDSTADTSDSSLNGTCDDGTGHCTLRAAIQESNNSTSTDETIVFGSGFTGSVATSQITATGSMPPITDPVTIDGGDCDATSAFKPCAGIEGTGSSSFSGLNIAAGGAGTIVRGLAFTNLSGGVLTSGGDNAIQANWFGIDLDGSASGNSNGTGVFLQSNGNAVGGVTPAGRNLFAQSVTAGVTILTGDSNTVTGNYFGTTPAGALDPSLKNGDSIQVAGFTSGPDPAQNNVIGGADTAGNTECDGPCNLLGNVNDDEIQLSSIAGGISPAASTTIKGNYIGLQLNGTDGNTATNASGPNGIEFGGSPTASNTTVGGPSAADRNYIGGNPTGIDTGQVADTATIQNNYIGVQPDGTGAVSNGIDSLDVSGTTSGSVQILNNRIGGNGAAGLEGIYAYGRNTVIKGNVIGVDTAGTVIGFGGPAIQTQGSTNSLMIGGSGAGEGNVIAGGAVAGIRLEDAAFTTVQGNFIGTDSAGTASLPNGGPGILAKDTDLQTTIGGTTAAAENVISNNGGDAIRVTHARGVKIERNHGSGNGEQFIDLENPSGPGNNTAGDGSADGLQAPEITDFDQLTQVTGTAEPNATVRVFTKSSAPAGELGTQIATATADPTTGAWTASFSAQPEGQRVVALQTVFSAVAPSGFESSELSDVVQLDTIAPVAPTISATDPTSPANDNFPEVSGTAEAGSTVTLYSDAGCVTDLGSGTAAQFASPGLTPNAAIPNDADTSFHATATDAAGHISPCSAGLTYTEDSTPPAISIDPPHVPAISSNDSPTFQFTATDAHGPLSYSCALEPLETASTCTPPKAYAGLDDGSYIFTVTGSDAAGNSSQQDVHFTVDTVPPQTVIDSAPQGTTNNNTPSVVFHANDANASGATFACRVDSGTATPCTSPAIFGPLADGPHTISIVATDAAGNEGPPAAASFTVSTAVAQPPLPGPAPVPKKKCKKKKHRAAAAKKKCKKKRR